MGTDEPCHCEKSTKRLIKPSELPIYGPQEDIYKYELKERSLLSQYVKQARELSNPFVTEMRQYRERASDVIGIGKSHMADFVEQARDDKKIIHKAGLFTGLGLFGYLLGRRPFKRFLYSSIGLAGAAGICYPEEFKNYSYNGLELVKKYSLISYNFVIGAKPEKELDVGTQEKMAAKSMDEM